MTLDQKRKSYEDRGLSRTDLNDCPIEQFRIWFQAATDDRPGRWFEPDAMALATSDSHGRVSVRMVLLKGITDDGFRFFTNYESQKGKQLAQNPNVAFSIHWPYQGRQVRVEGTVEKTSREVSREYFHSRHRGSQISAAISHQSEPVGERDSLVAWRDALEQKLDGAPVPLPEHWGGYLIRPLRIEFWQGRSNRLHDRIVFSRDDFESAWVSCRIAP